MSRRPRRNRPPRLDDVPAAWFPDESAPAHEAAPTAESAAALRRLLLDARLTGVHPRLGRDGVRQAVRQLVSGDRQARLTCDDLEGCTADEVRAALVKTHGWDPNLARAAIDPDATLAAARAAATRLFAAADAGARIAVATTRPASLLGLAQWVAAEVGARGGRVLTAPRASVGGSRSRELWWVGDVAVVTDRRSLLPADNGAGGDDWLFAVGRPDVVVADRAYAGAALRAGLDVVAWVDLDAPALSVAAARGRSLLVVPVDEQQPAAAYDALISVLAAPPAAPATGPA